jgi:hypothetical protein
MKNNRKKFPLSYFNLSEQLWRLIWCIKLFWVAQFYELKEFKKRFIKKNLSFQTRECRKSPANRLTDWMLRAIREIIE